MTIFLAIPLAAMSTMLAGLIIAYYCILFILIYEGKTFKTRQQILQSLIPFSYFTSTLFKKIKELK